MRISSLAGIAALVCLTVTPAYAIPISWDLEATIARTNLVELDVAPGNVLAVNMVLNSDSPALPTGFADGYGYLNVFDAFTLNLNGHTLALGPKSDVPIEQRDSNWLVEDHFGGIQRLNWLAVLYDGDTAYELDGNFEFTDLDAFPTGSLPGDPPSLASARLAEFMLFKVVPNNGGLLFVAGGAVDSWTTATPVPEPGSVTLTLTAFALLGLARRRRLQKH